MSSQAVTTVEERVLMLVEPDHADLVRVLAGDGEFDRHRCSGFDELCAELDAGAAAVVMPEESIDRARVDCLLAFLEKQPPWSDLPVLVIAREADSAILRDAIDKLGNVIVVERPVRDVALATALRAAVRARRRQYQLRDHMRDREASENVLRFADRSKAEFLAILAHELRNPLAPIRNSLHILELTGRADPTARRASAMMERQVSLMVRLVDDLLEASRITRGKVELRRDAVDLATAIGDAVESSRPLVDAGAHTLSVVLPNEPLLVEGDAVRLAQVFSNLLDNAAKYTDPGGHIELTVATEGTQAVVAVSDTGTGIPEDMLSRVFDMFTQADVSANRAQGGLGIGLALVRSLVSMHGGTIEAFSAGRGKGSTFTVHLPLLRQPAADDDPIAAGPAQEAAAGAVLHRVMIVDDNRDAAESLGTLLRLLGAEVHVATSGADALKALEHFPAEMILLDIGMPVLSGYEVARRIRALPRMRDVMLVALTGWGQEEDRQRSHLAGFDHHLVKPADVAVLQRLLGAIDTRSARKGGGERRTPAEEG